METNVDNKCGAFTSLEQSKKLAEILPMESADMYYHKDRNHNFVEYPHFVKEYQSMTDRDIIFNEDVIPCWSLAALMDMLPSEFTEVGKYSTTTYEIKIRKYKFTDEVNLHQIAYGSYKWYEDGGYTWSDMINTGEKENLIDAVFQMICCLKENNKL